MLKMAFPKQQHARANIMVLKTSTMRERLSCEGRKKPLGRNRWNGCGLPPRPQKAASFLRDWLCKS